MDIVDQFERGHKVVTCLGTAASPDGSWRYACLFADYSDPSILESERKTWNRVLEEAWDANEMGDSVNVTINPTEVIVESRKRTQFTSFERGEVSDVRFPNIYITAPYETEKEFFRRLEENRFFMLHMRTENDSYLYVVGHPGGKILEKYKRPRIEVKEM